MQNSKKTTCIREMLFSEACKEGREDSRSITENDDKMAYNQKHFKSPISNNHVKVQLFRS